MTEHQTLKLWAIAGLLACAAAYLLCIVLMRDEIIRHHSAQIDRAVQLEREGWPND